MNTFAVIHTGILQALRQLYSRERTLVPTEKGTGWAETSGRFGGQKNFMPLTNNCKALQKLLSSWEKQCKRKHVFLSAHTKQYTRQISNPFAHI